MTENMKIAISAVNKFQYFAWNFNSVAHEWKDSSGNHRKCVVPEFLVKVNWTCGFGHILNKWKNATKSNNPDAYLPAFYKELDRYNRTLLLEWVVANYNGEQKIF